MNTYRTEGSVLRIVNWLAQKAKHEHVVIGTAERDSLRRLIEASRLHVLTKFSFVKIFVFLQYCKSITGQRWLING